MADDDIFSSMGGSLLNDLLSDLDAFALPAENDPTDDLFASLKNDFSLQPSSNAGAFVVSRQKPADNDLGDAGISAVDAQDAWTAALAQFGGMSLAEEFLAADTKKKQLELTSHSKSVATTRIDGTNAANLVDMVFDEYAIDEEARVDKQLKLGEEADDTGGLMALLGASRAKTDTATTPKKVNTEVTMPTDILSPQVTAGTKAPPPSPMLPPSHLPPPPPPHGAIMPQMNIAMFPPPMGPGMPPPHLMMPPGMPPMGPGMPGLPPHVMPGPHPPHRMPPFAGVNQHTGPPVITATKTKSFDKNFPALGATPREIDEGKEEMEESPQPTHTLPTVRTRILFNNPDPAAPPILASLVESPSMPSRDITFVVNAMMRPLSSLDAYNDDYYHWSYLDRKRRNLLMLGMSPIVSLDQALPNPVWKEVKEFSRERETKFRESLDLRSKEFAEKQKSLGRSVKSNVHRPRALLNTAAIKKEEGGSQLNEEEECKRDSLDYEAEQKRLRIQLWKARVAIDKGYTAFLTLTELRRLIQANAGATQLIQDLTGDVKANVNLMHASFGVGIQVDTSNGNRNIEVDPTRLESTISMPKGRILLSRVVEGGILPHSSACEILPTALSCIFSTALPAAEGEERLLRALTGLVLTVQPSVDPSVLSRCLDVAIAAGQTNGDGPDGAKTKLPNITGSRTRMELLHAILSRGRVICAEDKSFGWVDKEKQFMALLT